MNNSNSTVAGRLQAAMVAAKMNQLQLARASKVSQPTIGRYLLGSQTKLESLHRLADALMVSREWLVAGVAQNQEPKPDGTTFADSKNEYGDLELWRRRARSAEQKLAVVAENLRQIADQISSAPGSAADFAFQAAVGTALAQASPGKIESYKQYDSKTRPRGAGRRDPKHAPREPLPPHSKP